MCYNNFSKMSKEKHIIHLTNQIYKLLPCREEGKDWEKPLETIIEEVLGFKDVNNEQEHLLLSLVCKLKGLYHLSDNYILFRRTIFDCLNLLGEVNKNCLN